jgi:hypothetical protein
MTKPTAAPIKFHCKSCGAQVSVKKIGEPAKCSACKATLGRVGQLDQLLLRWYSQRRWRADLVQPNAPFLVERLWTANDQGTKLYEGVAPPNTSYGVFVHEVTRVIMDGVEDGWAQLTFPADPMAEDPNYELKIVDSEAFAKAVEKLYPEVNWDEQIESPFTPAADEKPKAKGKKKA